MSLAEKIVVVFAMVALALGCAGTWCAYTNRDVSDAIVHLIFLFVVVGGPSIFIVAPICDAIANRGAK